MAVETSFEIANRKNIEGMKEVIRFERERTTQATKMAQAATENCTMLRTEVEQLRGLVTALLAKNHGSAN